MPTTISVIQLGHTPIIGRKAIVKTGNGKWQQTATVTSYTKNEDATVATITSLYGKNYIIKASEYNAKNTSG